ncbi:hypothetical protein BH10BAC5_BH10BAC5_16970 [soil metagenome]
MAQPKLEYLLIELAKRLGDDVTTAAGNGNTFSSADRLTVINNARDKVYNDKLPDVKDVNHFMMLLANFKEIYPEFLKSASITCTSGAATRPADCRKVFGPVYLETGSLMATETPAEYLNDMRFNANSIYKASASRPKYFEDASIKIYGVAAYAGNISITYLAQPTAAILGGANPDIIEPVLWKEDILDAAFVIVLKDLQKYK